MPLLASFGYEFFTSTFQYWWRRWRARRHPIDDALHELQQIATSEAGRTPSDELITWIRELHTPTHWWRTNSWTHKWLLGCSTSIANSATSTFDIAFHDPTRRLPLAEQLFQKDFGLDASYITHAPNVHSSPQTLENPSTTRQFCKKLY